MDFMCSGSPIRIGKRKSRFRKQPFQKLHRMETKKQRGGARPNTGPKRGASLPASGDLVKMPPIWVDAETLEFLRTLPNLSEFVRLAIKDKRSTGTMKDKLKEFVCPIDDRVKIQVPEWADYTPHCTTTMPNAACKYIGFGCVGCRVDKEAILLFQKTVSEQLRDLKKK